jgi:hypothetical protein
VTSASGASARALVDWGGSFEALGSSGVGSTRCSPLGVHKLLILVA